MSTPQPTLPAKSLITRDADGLYHYTTDENTPPPMSAAWGAWYWELSADPFHPEAFEGVFESMGATNPYPKNTLPRKAVWLAIDYSENPVGVAHFGTFPFGSEPPKEEDIIFTMKMGYTGNMFAYPPNSNEMLERHAMYERNNKLKESQNV